MILTFSENHLIIAVIVYLWTVWILATVVWSNLTHTYRTIRRDRFMIGSMTLIWPLVLPVALAFFMIYAIGLVAETSSSLVGAWLGPEITFPNEDEIEARHDEAAKVEQDAKEEV